MVNDHFDTRPVLEEHWLNYVLTSQIYINREIQSTCQKRRQCQCKKMLFGNQIIKNLGPRLRKVHEFINKFGHRISSITRITRQLTENFKPLEDAPCANGNGYSICQNTFDFKVPSEQHYWLWISKEKDFTNWAASKVLEVQWSRFHIERSPWLNVL